MTISRRTVAATLMLGLAARQARATSVTFPIPRLAIAGLTHGHAHWVFQAAKRGDTFEIVGIAEPDRKLARQYVTQYGLSMDLVHDDLATMLDKVKPMGVMGYGSVARHVDIVRTAAPRKIHVMVEKPLAVSLSDAREMAALAKRHNIHLLTNYETTWYPTVETTQGLLASGAIGPLRKTVFHAGHKGPKEIGVGPEFLNWLTDPAQNGGGAIIDFGCYGANLMTYLHQGKRPVSVTAVTRTFKPEVYPTVDDDATIIVDYGDAQAIIQASWNWPVSRKDMELYGATGQIIADDGIHMRLVTEAGVKPVTAPERRRPGNDPFAYFCAVIRGEITPQLFEPSALDNNLIVMEILDAALRSAKTGQMVRFT
ncbi:MULTISPECIES: Gfo/Idh/MocA family protein [Asticcacaulis]|uniref:Gfo/Idh/MocA family protein n=1 Tax=Asticcacaulis TaxID=76890 RepID=UPI001FD903E4|nr:MULTISPECIES: Gfo/Idh/MocA family oxidoreductase [Asticcacaulis]MBP2159645.1 putative dehydrogenase [Asticcacaulis solisilvae]MDR6800528.1 putative dehydrogenase [Asticcacaulis sp. BE141]